MSGGRRREARRGGEGNAGRARRAHKGEGEEQGTLFLPHVGRLNGSNGDPRGGWAQPACGKAGRAVRRTCTRGVPGPPQRGGGRGEGAERALCKVREEEPQARPRLSSAMLYPERGKWTPADNNPARGTVETNYSERLEYVAPEKQLSENY